MYESMKSGRNDATDTLVQEALGQSETFLGFQERLSRVAQVDRPVLVVGERGTGKELAAKRLHYLSKRWQEPLVELNCASLAPSLIESELFGHEAGSFTGATARRRGRFEAADGGTLFLDELGSIPLQVQEKILRVVEYGGFERVGGSERIKVDVRIVGATNADLPTLAEEGKFMPDLLDRLSFEVLYLPPLRERRGDILLLAKHFASRMAFELGRDEVPEFSGSVTARLESHPWRGNIRELKNVVERAVYLSDTKRIKEVVFDPFESPFALALRAPHPEMAAVTVETKPGSLRRTPDFDTPFHEAVTRFERELIDEALAATRFNQRQAAKLLGLSYHQFRGLYRKYMNESCD